MCVVDGPAYGKNTNSDVMLMAWPTEVDKWRIFLGTPRADTYSRHSKDCLRPPLEVATKQAIAPISCVRHNQIIADPRRTAIWRRAGQHVLLTQQS